MLWVIVDNVKREHTVSFYRASSGKFVIVLKQPNLKDYYNHEINFKGKVRGHKHTLRIFSKLPPRFRTRFNRHDENEVFLTMFLPKTISDSAVNLAFLSCSKVLQVFAGTYKKDFHEIQNGKRHIRLTHYDKNEIPHQIRFEGQKREFVVYWAEKRSSMQEM